MKSVRKGTDMRISQIIFILIILLFIFARKDYWRMAKTMLIVYATKLKVSGFMEDIKWNIIV